MAGNGIKFSMKIDGLDALRRRFRMLPEEVQKKELARAVSKGAAVIGKEARSLAPVLQTPTPERTAGLLRRMVRWTSGVRRDSEASAFVTVRRPGGKALAKAKTQGKGSGQVDPWYWRMVEFGTSKMAAIPFMRPAFESKKQQAAEVIKKELAEGVERQANALRNTA